MSHLAVLQSSQDPPVRLETEPRRVRPDSLLGQPEIQLWVIGRKKPAAAARGFSLAAIERARVVIQIRNAAAAALENTQQEMAWLRDHAGEYAGRWVALKGNQLLAVAGSAADVYAQIGQRADAPMVARVPQNNELPFAGW